MPYAAQGVKCFDDDGDETTQCKYFISPLAKDIFIILQRQKKNISKRFILHKTAERKSIYTVVNSSSYFTEFHSIIVKFDKPILFVVGRVAQSV